ncbi:hypothetical protein F8388_011421 [Cannabis sativa]|uniref:F-box domain-containing protein n=1 Tax=Cannabis sativa TaxID=3483 RepID=A0A7J6EVZ1_CANSA|nr:hypothetical protein F8388_011421 [Cannabis sativa]
MERIILKFEKIYKSCYSSFPNLAVETTTVNFPNSALADLPWDTIVYILSLLPVQDLLCYKCLSKRWCSLIESREFIKNHLNRSMENNSNIFVIINFEASI